MTTTTGKASCVAAPLLEVKNLSIDLRVPNGYMNAVHDISFSLQSGEVLGLVGESGSGKSITMRSIMGLLPLKTRIGGSAMFNGTQQLLNQPDKILRRLRGKEFAMIFQDPMTALNPVLTVGDQIIEAIRVHDNKISDKAAVARSIELLRMVAIPSPEQRMAQYPHEFSGGMRQRVTIAIAMANAPKLIIADEPTTALDVTVQAQILEVLEGLRREHGVSIVLITHDLGVVAGMAHNVAVMYAGQIVERGSAEEIFRCPRHPYTAGLMASMPSLDTHVERLKAIPGAPPTLITRPAGCPFHPRCSLAQPKCFTEPPALRQIGNDWSACHFPEKVEGLCA